MKYVIFKRKELIVPVITSEMATHSDLKLEGFEPVSAGFIYMPKGLIIIDNRGSESLGLKPNKELDEKYITKMVLDLPASTFLDFNNEYSNTDAK
ncbi:hypothetical protein SAMN04515674_12175 [Pseudarcicella hirudinis]|uniref:Uncharacterized protein n=2 Tax=Pseudarcicella hirudinis TaxID=1079859 RepID=A0A1I5YUN9_9BACT|nr:hypothetical protein [Pseudarcicella hirudinis]SFQ27418.1 hypothetical protein SAMN04515674_113161 [Pseudarcicella hirudinis]SFQ47755.1 hypothetical protein SAMN04515674_12175 [Pseudarcicella hirudinis]